MAKRNSQRRAGLKGQLMPRVSSKDKFFDTYCRAIQRGKLVPIIGDAIRIAHIIDMNDDGEVGEVGDDYDIEALETALTNNDEDETDDENDEEEFFLDFDSMNVTEQVAYLWARSEGVNYPLKDGFQIARVAQFQSLAKKTAIIAKEEYLNFLKEMFLAVAMEWQSGFEDEEELAFIEQLKKEPTLTFADIVTELDFPRFENGKPDPLRKLAQLPLKIYVTTSYHNFLERELEAAGKRPLSRFCHWNTSLDGLSPEFHNTSDDLPEIDRPVVFHLLGMEQHPESMVLSEDDYLDLLWALARDAPGSSHRGKGIIPPYLEAELKDASLLLLGYRLQDWDLRVLFRGLLRKRQSSENERYQRYPGTVIQLDFKNQPLVQDEDQAKIYLDRYFNRVSLDVHFSDSDTFVNNLGEKWQEWSQGKK